MLTKITITRNQHHYIMSLERGQETVAKNRPITRNRAIEIVEENPDGRGNTCFSTQPCNWVWWAELEGEAM